MTVISPARTSTRGFWFGVAATLLMLVGAAAPSPFYPVLQDRLDFSAATMTLIFAIYAVFLLAALLVTGSLSDHVGRRPVVSAGFAVLAVSMIMFWHADAVSTLLAARVVQGLATGVIMSALAALVVDFEPPGSEQAATFNTIFPLVGLATGGLLGGVAIEYVDAPTAWVFGGLSVVFVVVSAAVWLLPEPVERTAGAARSLVPRAAIPQAARATFWRGAPAIFAGWATGGLYLSLGAPLVGRELGSNSHVLQGLVVSVLTGVGAATVYLARRRSAREVSIAGTLALATGTAATLVALSQQSLAGFLVAGAMTGTGFGTAFYGFMRSVTPTVGPAERGELFGAVFTVAYLAFGIPAVVAGIVSAHLGLATTTYVYGGAVIVLSLVAAALRRFTTDA